jgi:CheY-like chemotaxis protein
MKILIIEDKPKHILSAEKFAKECGHEVVIVDNYDDANKALNRKYENGEFKPFDYDMVMTDLFLPASKDNLPADVYKTFEGVEQPYGIALMLKAITQGAKKAGILTDSNHHTNPMTNALDFFAKMKNIGDATFCVMQLRLAPEDVKDWNVLFEKLNN